MRALEFQQVPFKSKCSLLTLMQSVAVTVCSRVGLARVNSFCICWLAEGVRIFFCWLVRIISSSFYMVAGWLKAPWQDFLVGKDYFSFFTCGWLAEGLLAASRLVRGHGGTFVPLICQILDTL